ncbi:hypothetical protein [Rhizobium leucaenae]|uniref:hypothetical protein n=1 Tax=Rhizobium leucaenae TaxID=29450 RepID=UPI0016123495|nr:hypothetical protein [Rhizobium leucaenae]MBB6304041.1 hypothetical protein [Rhizobium leucaenae]
MTDALVAADAAPMSDAISTSAPDVSSTPAVESPREPTPRNAIDRAFAALEARESGDPATADGQQPQQRERNPDGTFKTKSAEATASTVPKPAVETKPTPVTDPAKQTNFAEAPARFSPDAKSAWAAAPEQVRAEVTRALKELETGIEQHRQNFEPYREFDKQIKANGQTFKEVFDHYTGIEQLLAQNPLGGLDRICQNLGLSLRQVAAHVMGQAPDQANNQQEATIRELRNEIASLKSGLSGVSTSIQSQKESAALAHVQQFAGDKPRFEELANDIRFFLESGRIDANLPLEQKLAEAYALAERLNPAPVQTQTPPAAATADAAQTRTNKGQLSTTGAPSSGSNPANRKQPASSREALDRAFASVGL